MPRHLSTVALALFAVVVPHEAQGTTILTYVGETYSSVQNDPVFVGEYDTSMRVTGWVEIAESLEPNGTYSFESDFSGVDTLLAFSFFDGLWYHDRDHESGSLFSVGAEFASLDLTTDGLGNIIEWSFFWSNLLAPGVPVGGGDMDMLLSSVSGDLGYLICDNCDPVAGQGFQTGGSRIGQWTVVPEPSTLWLLSLGAAATGLARGRSRRVE